MENVKFENVIWCFGLSSVLYIDVSNASMRFQVRFCIYEHILDNFWKRFSNNPFSEMTGMQNQFFVILKLLLRPWDLSHRVERQKLLVNSREEMFVRVWKGGFVANLLLR